MGIFNVYFNNIIDIEEEGIDYFLVEIDENLNKSLFLIESIWKNSGKKNWMYRVDPKNDLIKLKRHICISKEKYINTKTQQASWNDDGTRHDKMTFNTEIGNIKLVKQIAREVLNLPNDVVLEEVVKSENDLKLLNESYSDCFSIPLFEVY